MKYQSTRGANGFTFSDTILLGFAPDGGLFVPETIPSLEEKDFDRLSQLTFPELCLEICRLYVTPEEFLDLHLQALCHEIYKSFDTPNVIELVKIYDGLYIGELFHGPTYAFKDIGLQFLGNLIEKILQLRKKRASIVVATSGDTGSAAIHGVMDKPSIDLFVLFPRGKISKFQEKQMTTIGSENIHVMSVEGTSDDLDISLKEISVNKKFCSENNITFINSFNWGRILIQSVHYFYCYFQALKDSPKTGNKYPKISFSIPTGAMGNTASAMLAHKMGLPFEKIIVSNNSNDILRRYFQSGDFSKKSVVQTHSPSMDIQQPYNFERFLYFMLMDALKVRDIYTHFEKTGEMKIDPRVFQQSKTIIESCSVDESTTLKIIQHFQQKYNYILDPHTAVGVGGAIGTKHAKPIVFEDNSIETTQSLTVICLATAHACKFEESVKIATNGISPDFPKSSARLLDKPDYHMIVPSNTNLTPFLMQLIAETFAKKKTN